MTLPPNEPQGGTPLVQWQRRLLAFAKSLRIKSGLGYRVHQGDDGVRLEIVGSGGGGRIADVAVKRFAIGAVADSYLTCAEWDGTTSGATYYIAMPKLLRNITKEQTIDGVDYDYEKTTDQRRSATWDSGSETQVIVPRYIVGDEIFATEPEGGTDVTGGDSAECTWIDLNVDGRAWAREYE